MWRIRHWDSEFGETWLSRFSWENSFQGCSWTTDSKEALEGEKELMAALTRTMCLEPLILTLEAV